MACGHPWEWQQILKMSSIFRAREECNVAQREKEEAEAEQKLAEAQQHHAFFVKEQWEDR